MSFWTPHRMTDQSGKTFVITGANSGIGYEATMLLLRKGAKVIMACRNAEKGERAKASLLDDCPGAELQVAALDLASLESVQAFAADFLERGSGLDGLVNNAGVMALPRRETADGFEMQLGTNHLGHFALTAKLLPALLKTPGSRVVTVSSMAHRVGRIHFEDLHGAKSYSAWGRYGQSKVANLLFMAELDRKFKARGLSISSVACHPGYAATNLQGVAPQMDGSALRERLFELANSAFAQSAEMGAWPTVFAATNDEVCGGDYIGPSGVMEMAGPPKQVGRSGYAKNRKVAARLWQVSEEETGCSFQW